jgi:hypothetical protein
LSKQKKGKEMKTLNHKIVVFALIIIALPLAGCQKQTGNYEKVEPVHVEHIEGSELSKLILTEKAVERTGIQTALVTQEMIASSEESLRLVAPYSSLLYDAHGHIWVYTNPEPRTYLRHEVKVDFIEGDKAILLEGPPVGTMVVTLGAAELYGAESGVGH